MTDLMIDLETWAPTENAVIRAAAVVAFDPRGAGITGRLLIDARAAADDQIEKRRGVDPETVAWWCAQQSLSESLRGEDAKPVSCLAKMLNEIEAFIHPLVDPETGRIRGNVWTRGHFDCRILRHAWHAFGDEAPPWGYWQEMDVRTLDVLVARVRPDSPHDPMSDCLAQIRQVQTAHALVAPPVSRETSEIQP